MSNCFLALDPTLTNPLVPSSPLPPREELREVDRDESDEGRVGLLSATGNLESFRIPGLVGRDRHSSCKHGATESLTELLVAFLMDLALFD